MITGIPELNRYLDDAQWKTVAQAIRAAGGKVTDGNRLHVDAVLDLMATRRPWRDLDFRYGPWAGVHAKFCRWFETGILHGVVTALFKLGLTDGWRETYVEISKGPSAMGGPQIRPLMAQIANELRRHAAAPRRGRKSEPRLPKPTTDEYRSKRKAYAARVREAVKARKGLVDGRMSDADWGVISTRIHEFNADNSYRRQVEELCEVMRTNKGWSYMDSRVGKWNAAYGRFMKWVSDGTMTRLVKCLHELGLTKNWSSFLLAPLADGEKSLKRIIGHEAYVNMTGSRKPKKPAKRAAGTSEKTDKTAKKTAAKRKTAKITAKKTRKAAGSTTAARKAKTAALPATPKAAGKNAAPTAKTTEETKRRKTSAARSRVKAGARTKAAKRKASPTGKARAASAKRESRPRGVSVH